MQRDLELMTSLLIEAENSCGREISDTKEIESILLLQDEEYVDAQTQYSDDGMPQSTKVIRVRSKGHSALEDMRASESRILKFQDYKEVKILENETEKVRDGLVSTRDKEIARYENILYAVSAGIIALSLGILNFCFMGGILYSAIKWMLFATFTVSGITIISLIVSEKASVNAREYAVKKLDNRDDLRQEEYVQKTISWNNRIFISNGITLASFIVCIVLTLMTIIIIMIILPNNPVK